MIELNIVLASRRHMQALQIVMQSERASLLEKQEAELQLLRRQVLELKNAKEQQVVGIEARIAQLCTRNMNLYNDLNETTDNYLSLIDECVEVESDARGMRKIKKIANEHRWKRIRTDRR